MTTLASRASLATAGALAALVGCTSYGPGSLAPGATVDAATTSMGPPTGDYALADGRRRLEFARGPYGKHTWMLDFDAQGRLQSSEQVLNEARFNAVRAGMEAD